MSNLNTDFKWEVKYPFANFGNDRERLWIDELSKMRGEIIYENGKRPSFKTATNKYVDADGLDEFCYHILARVNNEIVGCVRFLPLLNASTCLTKKFLKPDAFTTLIKTCSKPNRNLFEGSRLIVHPKYQSRMLPVMLLSASYALANKLSADFIASVGTCTGQDKFLKACGGKNITGFESLVFCERYQDHITFLLFNTNEPGDLIKSRISKMLILLKLHESKGSLTSSIC